MNEEAVMIWSHDGAWFQCPGKTGRVRTFLLGPCDYFKGLADFCRDAGISLRVFSHQPSSDAKRPAAHAARAQRHGKPALANFI
jgi:hypothetical protein